jgi:hypothetical protein
MDIIQGLIESGNVGSPGWRIVNNNGTFEVLNNRSSNVIFSILNGGSIEVGSNIYSNVVPNYVEASVGISSQWTTSGDNIYYNTSNIGIGTNNPITPLHIYNTSNTRLLLDTTSSNAVSIEFKRGVGNDIQSDFRFINDTNGYIKLQYENNAQTYSDTTANLAWFSSNETIIHKNTAINGRVGIGSTYHTTRSLDVVGDANISGFVSTSNLSVSGSATITNSLTNNTSLTIQNSFIAPIPTEIVVSGTSSNIIGATDRCITFPYSGSGTTKDYTFTTTENIICDILVVGGGGAGGNSMGGGGGAGGVVYVVNQTLTTGTYTVKV